MNTTPRRLLLGWPPAHRNGAASARVGHDAWRDYRRRLLARRLLVATAVVVVIASVLGAAVVQASRHYRRGQQAFAAGHYDRAASEFAAARVLTISYRDAGWLSRAAQQQAAARPKHGTMTVFVWPLEYRLLLARTLRDLRDGRYLSAAAAVGELRRTYAAYPLDLGRHGARAAARAAERLLALGGERFQEGRWRGATAYVDAALVLQPDWVQALELGRRARSFASVAPLFARVQAWADHGAWKRATRALRRVVAVAPGYPGAARLLATARAKIAARPHKSGSGGATPSPTPTTSPTPKPAPTPTPTPTLPPPP